MPQSYHVVQLPLLALAKICSHCHAEKPLEEFYRDRTSSDGHKPHCKACRYISRRKETPEKPRRRSIYSQSFISTTSKTCYVCKQEKPFEEFHKDKSCRDGHASKCRECAREHSRSHGEEIRHYHQAYHQANKDRLNADSRARYYATHERRLKSIHAYQSQEATKERRRIRQQERLSRPEQREKRYLYHAMFRVAHPEIVSARNRAWRQANPLIVRQGYTRHRARKRQATIGDVSYVRILVRDGYHCYICNKPVSPGDIHFDHVIPLARNGPHSEDNIKVTHAVCNLRKGSHLPEEMTPFQRRGVE
jgi:5-methylcytosine-specific restriction endonuclease McrA